ncbi:hypothetical protein [Agrobacterium tumefaciens]|uniref:hypothetical protein n=1 Tax=Agrobacterium tumefaciens TaxID=358 RepID=UPI0015716668|nr:hypothetical protein [Agrobacterium tumefaciens]
MAHEPYRRRINPVIEVNVGNTVRAKNPTVEGKIIISVDERRVEPDTTFKFGITNAFRREEPVIFRNLDRACKTLPDALLESCPFFAR